MLNASKADTFNKNSTEVTPERTQFYNALRHREQQWWQARQQLVELKERQIFWFGDNSAMMWWLWQLVSCVVMIMVLMLLEKAVNLSLSIEVYLIVFALQMLIFIIMLTLKGRLGHYLQDSIHNQEMMSEQALNEMAILASDSLFLEVHDAAPVSLQHIYERHNAQLRLTSLYRLLQHEIQAGRLILNQPQLEADALPLELADDQLVLQANDMIYRSVV